MVAVAAAAANICAWRAGLTWWARCAERPLKVASISRYLAGRLAGESCQPASEQRNNKNGNALWPRNDDARRSLTLMNANSCKEAGASEFTGQPAGE